MSDEDSLRGISIDGEEWVAVRHLGDRYVLFKEGWSGDAGTYLPGEKGLCSYCLEENRLADDDPGTMVCDECGSTEPIVHGERIPVSDVR